MGPQKSNIQLFEARRVIRGGTHVFREPLARIFDDEDHSIEEQREIIIGYLVKERLLIVCFTAQGESVRIFSARRATRRERKEYEENVKS